jgi:hypothetical protein
MKKLTLLGIIGGAALLTAAPLLQRSQKNVPLSLDSAEARIGRPLTATCVAGVSRRVHRRAYRRAVYGTALPDYSSPPDLNSYYIPPYSYASSYAYPSYSYAAPYRFGYARTNHEQHRQLSKLNATHDV